MSSPKIFVAPYFNKSYEYLSAEKQDDRVRPRVEKVSRELIILNRRTGGHLFADGLTILHSHRPPAVRIADMLIQKLATDGHEAIKATAVETEHAYQLGDRPNAVKSPREWLLEGVVGHDVDPRTPLLALSPSGFVDYLNQEYNPTATYHPDGHAPVIELTEDTVWTVDPNQAFLEAKFHEERRLEQVAGFGSLV